MTAPARRLRITPSPGIESPLRVLFLIDSLGPGGAERLMVDLLPQLREHGVEPTVAAIQEKHGNPVASELRAAGFEVRLIGIDRLRRRGALAKVVSAVEQTAPAVVHTQLEFASILGTIAARRLGIPTISTIHTLDRPRRFSRDAARFRVMAWALRTRGDRVVAVSDSARRHVLERAGLPRGMTTTIHNGIDLAPYRADRAADGARLRAELGIGSEAPILTTVAVLRPPKAIDDMLDALPAILHHHPDAVHLIAGDGPHRSALVAHAAALGLGDSVRFLGRVDDVAGVLAASNLFVLPSRTEALPTVVIEAMAAGLPVVATDVGGTAELVDSALTGILVPPGDPGRMADAVVRMLDAPRQAEAMGIAARRVASERFAIDRQAARLADEYRVLVARRRAS